MCSRYSLSVSAVLTSRRSRRRIAPGTVRSMRSSREGAPRVRSMAFWSSKRGPKCRETKLPIFMRIKEKRDETFRRKRKNTSPVLPPNDKVSTSRPPMPLLRPSVADLCAHVLAWPVVYACLDCPGGVRHDHPQLDVGRGRIPHGTRGDAGGMLGGSLNRPGIHHSTGDQTRQKPRNDAAPSAGILGPLEVGDGRGWAGRGCGSRSHAGGSLRWDHPERLWVVVGLGIASLGYAFVPGTQGGFRNVVGLKVPLIAGVWATATTHHPELGLDPLLWVQRSCSLRG